MNSGHLKRDGDNKMSFQQVYQNDPRWENTVMGHGQTETIGRFGCLLTSMAMVGNYFGGNETPASLNQKLKDNNGFQGPWVRAFRISSVFSGVNYQRHIECNGQPAPMADIDAALAAGSLAVVRVDNSPAPGIQSHWVVIHQKAGNDYLIWDPHHSPDKPDTLAGRFGFAGEPEDIVQEAILFGRGQLPETKTAESPPPVPPATPTKADKPAKKATPARSKPAATQPTGTTKPASPSTGSQQLIVQPTVNGLTLRQQPRVTPTNILKHLALGDKLLVLDDVRTARVKIGQQNQWVKVRNVVGQEGFVAAWYVTPADAPALGVQAVDDTHEPSKPTKLLVKTAADGVALRSQPRVADETLLHYLPFGTELLVIEQGNAEAKIGRQGQWLQVQTVAGVQGYLAAWLVRSAR
jgi:hypothetical protein